MGKVCEPLDVITGWPSFGSKNLNQPVVVDQTCTTVRSSFGPFLFTNLFQDINILGMSGVNRSLIIKVMPQHLNRGWGQDSDWATPEGQDSDWATPAGQDSEWATPEGNDSERASAEGK